MGLILVKKYLLFGDKNFNSRNFNSNIDITTFKKNILTNKNSLQVTIFAILKLLQTITCKK